jgi:predicted transcriptional regulator
MRTVTLHLSETEYEQLRALACAEDQTAADVIHKAIQEYVQRKASHAEFRAALERATQENAELIAQLAES